MGMTVDYDKVIEVSERRYAEMVDRYNDLLRYCMALPLLVRVGRAMEDGSNVVEIDQLYLDQLAKLVAKIREQL